MLLYKANNLLSVARFINKIVQQQILAAYAHAETRLFFFLVYSLFLLTLLFRFCILLLGITEYASYSQPRFVCRRLSILLESVYDLPNGHQFTTWPSRDMPFGQQMEKQFVEIKWAHKRTHIHKRNEGENGWKWDERSTNRERRRKK